MPLSKSSVLELVNDQLYPAFQLERQRIDAIDCWYRHDHEPIQLPPKSTLEHRRLAELARTPFLGLVVTNVAQALFVDGYRSPADDVGEEGAGDSAPWNLWLSNRLAGRQGAIWRAALAFGHAYGTALPGVDDFDVPTAVMRGVSPRKMLAFYADPAEDDWPLYALRVESAGGNWVLRLYDDTSVYNLSIENGSTLFLDFQRHDLGFCPVVRFGMIDLDGRSDGEVVPFIPLAKRIDKTIYDRLLVQHFNSWKVRTVSGMAQPDTTEEAEKARLLLRQQDLLISDSIDTKFGVLDETGLDGFISAYESDIRTLAAASQTPVHAMVGDLINLSADALVAARAALDAKVEERQSSFASSTEQWLRAGALVVGDDASARDMKAHVVWRDTSIRSMASAADALGKFAQMLGVPVEALWAKIPGVTKVDIEEWKQMRLAADPVGALLTSLGPTAPGAPAAPPVPPNAPAVAPGL